MQNNPRQAKQQAYALSRNIIKHGQKVTFTRYMRNSYDETTSEIDISFDLSGLFHSGFASKGLYKKRTTDENGTYFERPQPMFMVLRADFDKTPVQFEDVMSLGGKMYKVIFMEFVGGANFAVDISLDVV